MNIDFNGYFVLYSCCVVVKGYTRSIICDIQRDSFDFIPNILSDLLNHANGLTLNQLFKACNINIEEKENREIVESYYTFLIEKEYGFITNNVSEVENFRPLDANFFDPVLITNAIIDADINSNHDYENILQQLTQLGCSAIEFRFFEQIHASKLIEIASLLKNTTIRCAKFIVKHSDQLTDEFFYSFFSNRRIFSFICYGAMEDKVIPLHSRMLIYCTETIADESCCGIVSPQYFTVNTKSFVEAKNYNSCLNKKVSVDRFGNIKNCPSFYNNFGHISKTSISDILNNNEFVSIWQVSKDQIEVCKDCEFRYICPDCQAYTKTGQSNSKPAKCNYDPYKGVWE